MLPPFVLVGAISGPLAQCKRATPGRGRGASPGSGVRRRCICAISSPGTGACACVLHIATHLYNVSLDFSVATVSPPTASWYLSAASSRSDESYHRQVDRA